MREYKFRGYAVEEMVDSQWLYGTGVDVGEYTDEYAEAIGKKEEVLLFTESGWMEVVKESVGQFTGIKKDGIDVYERDILSVRQDNQHTPNRDSGGGIIDFDQVEGFSQVGVVHFNSCSFAYKTTKTIAGRHEEIHAPIDWLDDFKVVGNVIDNPELLESK